MRRRVVIGLALLGTFWYGFAAGSYRLPPFFQVAWVKNSLVERLWPPKREYVPTSPQSVTILETALQRLLVKRVPLPNANAEFSGGGALATVGDLLFILTGGGHVTALDVTQARYLRVEMDDLPINRGDLMRSRARYAISLAWFRVSGAYAEVVDDSTQRLFVTHNRFDPQRECFTFNISRVTLVRREELLRARGAWETIYTTAPCMTLQGTEGFGRHPFSGHISGGKMIAFDQRQLLVTVGDFTYDGYLREAWAMDSSNPYGKFILVDRESGRSETFAIGARNDMGLFRDAEGTIWATESGPQGGDELNTVVRGANYGWPRATYGINYGTSPWPLVREQGRHDEFRQPVFSWMPSVVPTNLVRIEGHGDSFHAWRGDLLLGTLRDQSLRRLRLDGAGRVAYDERIPFGDRIRDLVRLSDGKVALLTDASGYLVFLADGDPVYAPVSASVLARIAELERYDALIDTAAVSAASRTDGESLFARSCASCHALDGRTLQGPALNGVLGRRISVAGVARDTTVPGTDDRRWTPDLLRGFLLQPETDFVNTKMPQVPLTRAQADSLIAYLGRLPR